MVKTMDDIVKCCMLDTTPHIVLLQDLSSYFGFDNVDHLDVLSGLSQCILKIKCE